MIPRVTAVFASERASTDEGAMSSLRDVLNSHVSSGSVPGAVALVARGDQIETAAAGSADAAGTSPMARDSIFRIASITKPVTAAAAMMLVGDRRIALAGPVREWLPELAAPMVVRTPDAPAGQVVPAQRPITLADLLTFRAGYGFGSDFSAPAVGLLFSELRQGPRSRSSWRRPATGWRRCREFRCCTSRARHGCTTPAPTSWAC
jgi:CubicO group peptidase (beta-lactamase class C family)